MLTTCIVTIPPQYATVDAFLFTFFSFCSQRSQRNEVKVMKMHVNLVKSSIISDQVFFNQTLLPPPVIKRPHKPGQHLAIKSLKMHKVSPSLLSGGDHALKVKKSKRAVMKLLFQLACVITAEITDHGPF